MKANRDDRIPRALRHLADLLESASDDQLEQFERGDLKLALVPRDSVDKKRAPAKRRGADAEALPDSIISAIIDGLGAERSRAEVIARISTNEHIRSRDRLVELARALKVHVHKHDKRETIEDKIAEAIVGVRLRSGAIQSVNVGAGASGSDNG